MEAPPDLWTELRPAIVEGLIPVVAAVSSALVVVLRAFAVRVAARYGAQIAETRGQATGERGAQKLAIAHDTAREVLGVFAPSTKRLHRAIEKEVPTAERNSRPPPANGRNTR